MKRALVLAFLMSCTTTDDDRAVAPGPLEVVERSEPAISLPVSPTMPAPVAPPAPVRAASAPAPAIAPTAVPGCVARPEVLCDGVDQDCDRTDSCDADRDGIVELYAATGDPSRRVGVTTE